MRILFVDDEPAIRETMPAILSRHGFEVDVASTVAEALSHIHTSRYDVLISDLNIGEPGDGFTVVSAMRRTQPACRNIILTGYPGFESALQAIRNQVDEYLIKPTRISDLIQVVERETLSSKPRTPVKVKPLGAIMREHREEIVDRVLHAMKERGIGGRPLSDEERIDHLPELIDDIAERLEESGQAAVDPGALYAAAEHGRVRCMQGYALTDLVEDTRALDGVLYDIVQENLLAVDLSNLLPMLKRVNEALDTRLKESLQAFLEISRRAA